MNEDRAFLPAGKTVPLDAGAAAAAGVPAPCDLRGDSTMQQYLVTSDGSAIAYLGIGADATAAQNALATLPAPGAPQPGVPVVPGSAQTFTFPRGSYFSARAPVGTQRLYITPGQGV